MRLGLLLTAFVAASVIGIVWAMPPGHAFTATWRALGAMPIGGVLLLAGLTLAVVAAEMLRFAVMGRALGVRVGLAAAFDATVANNFFSWITPGAAMGEPAAIYMLGRHGLPWDAALLISFGKFATSFAFIMGLGLALLVAGFGPDVTPWAVGPLAGFVGVGALVIASFVIGAFRPASAQRRIDGAEAWLLRRRLLAGPRASKLVRGIGDSARGAVTRLAEFRRGGAPGSLAILGSHVCYYAAYVGMLVTLAWLFGADSALRVLPVAVIYLCFTYIAPTPGGSGLAEVSAHAFFGRLVPDAFGMVLLFRTLTCYLHVAFGMLYLPLVGALRAILSARPRTSAG